MEKKTVKFCVIISFIMGLMIFSFSGLRVAEAGKEKLKVSENYIDFHAMITRTVMFALMDYDNVVKPPETENFIVYYLDVENKNCPNCQDDIRKMFYNLLYQSELVKKKKLTLNIISRSDHNQTFKFLAESLATVFYMNGGFEQGILPTREEVKLMLNQIRFSYFSKVNFADLGIEEAVKDIPKTGIFPLVLFYGAPVMPDRLDFTDRKLIYIAGGGENIWSDVDDIIRLCTKENCFTK